MKPMDKLDYLILSELYKDASLSFVDIADKVGTTPYTVRRRFEKLKKEGIISKTVVSIDLSKLGYQGKAFLMITVASNSDKSQTIKFLKALKNTLFAIESLGPCDVLYIAPVTDMKSVLNLVKEVKKAPNVERVEFTCMSEVDFPICANFGKVLSAKCQALANSSSTKQPS